MRRQRIFSGDREVTDADWLVGVLFFNGSGIDSKEIVVIMGGFARVATKEKLLLAIAEKADKPCFIFDWHGLGMSTGNFGDVTVERLANDLKIIVDMLSAEGFSKFHFVGHSLGACVIALFVDKYANLFDIGKKILLAPALDQRYLLRYWFAREYGLGFTTTGWYAECAKNSSLLEVKKTSPGCNFDRCWNDEKSFQKEIHERKNIKGINFSAEYWEEESSMNYLYHLAGYDSATRTVSDKNTLFVFGADDKSVPFVSIVFSVACREILSAGHYFAGKENKVAKIANDFLKAE